MAIPAVSTNATSDVLASLARSAEVASAPD